MQPCPVAGRKLSMISAALPAKFPVKLLQAFIRIGAFQVEEHLSAASDQTHSPVILAVLQCAGINIDNVGPLKCMITANTVILHRYKRP